MRREQRRGLAIMLTVALAITAGMCAGGVYARLAAPFYAAAAALIATGHPWTVNEVQVADDPSAHGEVLRLTGEVRRRGGDARPAAAIESHVQVGEVIETPIIFWSVLLIWPASTRRERLVRLLLAVPVFLGLEILTTVCELLRPFAEAAALLNGEIQPLTLWERWTRLLEGGCRFVLEIAAAVFCAGASSALAVSRTRPPPGAVAGCPLFVPRR